MFRSSNPVLRTETFVGAQGEGQMTINGTINKTGFLLLLAMVSASFIWSTATTNVASAQGWMMLGVFGGFICAIICSFVPRLSPVLAPLYAVLEGLFLGGVSVAYNQYYPGIIYQAVLATFGVMMVMLFLYWSRIVKVSNRFMLGVVAATGGLAFIYFVALIMSFFGINMGIWGNGPVGLVFSIIAVTLASFNLLIDFFFIESVSRQSAPKYMEWYGAFSLMVTLVWLYLSILRLLSRLNRN